MYSINGWLSRNVLKMNINLPTQDELMKLQIESYSEMMNNPRSFEHKIFLRKLHR